jgi:hypothetical protein
MLLHCFSSSIIDVISLELSVSPSWHRALRPRNGCNLRYLASQSRRQSHTNLLSWRRLYKEIILKYFITKKKRIKWYIIINLMCTCNLNMWAIYTYKTLKSINRASGKMGSVVRLLKFNVLEVKINNTQHH